MTLLTASEHGVRDLESKHQKLCSLGTNLICLEFGQDTHSMYICTR